MSTANIPARPRSHDRRAEFPLGLISNWRSWSRFATKGRLDVGNFLVLAPFFIALPIYLNVFLVMQPLTTGDEPHYLIFAHSLAYDFDIDLRNNYVEEVSLRYYRFPMSGGHNFELPDGRLVSWHGIGLALLLAPVIFVGGGLLGARLEIIVISALLAQQLFGLLRDLRLGGPALTWLVWTAVVFCLPLVVYSNQVYPEVPAALLTVFSVRAIFAREVSTCQAWKASLAMAALPWLHVRYAPIAAALELGIAYRLLGSPPLASVPGKAYSMLAERRHWGRLLPIAAVPLGIVLLLASFQWMYAGTPGSLGPIASAWSSGSSRTRSGFWWSLDSIYGNGLGTLLNPLGGWLPFAPVHWLGIVGVLPIVTRYRIARFGLLAVLGYWTMVSGPIPAGSTFPARYAVVVAPFIAIPLLFLVSRSGHALLLFFPLLGLSAALAVAAVTHHGSLYPNPSGRTTVPIARDLQEIWPIAPWTANRLELRADQLHRFVGRLSERSPIEAHAAAPGDGPGVLAYIPFPYARLTPGSYVARFAVAARGASPADHIATLQVHLHEQSDPPRTPLLGRTELLLAELPPDGAFASVELPFATPSSEPLQILVHFVGRGELRVQKVEVVPTGGPAVNPERFPAWHKTLLWVVATLVVGSLFVGLLSPRYRLEGRSRSDGVEAILERRGA